MKHFISGSAAALLIATPFVSFAAYIHAGESVLIDSPQALASANAYVAGGNVTVSAAAGRDLIAVGGAVNVTGRIQGDLAAAGGTVVFVGGSAEDVRIAGGNLTIGSEVRGDLVIAGGQLSILSGTTVAEDAYIAGGNITFQGIAAKNVEFAGGTIHIDGTVNGNVLVRGVEKLTLGPRAKIRGNLEYTAPAMADIQAGATVGGETKFHEAARGKGAMSAGKKGVSGLLFGLLTLWWFAKAAMVLVAAYLIWYLRREDATHLVTRGTTRFWRELFVGFATLILVPVLAVLLCITMIGAIPGVVLGLVYAMLLIVAKPAAVLLTSALIMGRTNLAWYHILLGLLALEIAMFIPFIGWIAVCVVYLAALGSLGETLKPKFEQKG